MVEYQGEPAKLATCRRKTPAVEKAKVSTPVTTL